MSNQSESTVSSTTRHPEYYFPDGSAVLQVGRVLFKIQSSLLTEESEVFRGMFALPVAQQLPSEHPEQESSTKEGSCDENPILIPEVTPLAFEHFLLMFYGRPTDPEYLLMMADNTTSTKNHDYNCFCRYLDIADLSHRFVAPRLEAWALEQLKAQSTSIKKLSLGWATVNYQVRALKYASLIQDKSLGHRVWTFVALSYSYLLSNSLATLRESAIQPFQQNLLAMFKYPNLQKDHPSIFGFAFCAILSLGHEFWLHQPSLTRDDRIMLLSAHALLTPLPFSKLELTWTEDTLTEANPRGSEPGPQSCAQCNFQPVWKRAFMGRYPKDLRENQSPSGGVGLLRKLITKRMAFEGALADLSEGCTENCKERFIEFVDESIEHVFALFAGFYKDVQ